MGGTYFGGRKAYETQKARYGEDVMSRTGRLGGKKTGVKKGFASEKVGSDGLTGKQRAEQAGRLGGLRTQQKKAQEEPRD